MSNTRFKKAKIQEYSTSTDIYVTDLKSETVRGSSKSELKAGIFLVSFLKYVKVFFSKRIFCFPKNIFQTSGHLLILVQILLCQNIIGDRPL